MRNVGRPIGTNHAGSVGADGKNGLTIQPVRLTKFGWMVVNADAVCIPQMKKPRPLLVEASWIRGIGMPEKSVAGQRINAILPPFFAHRILKWS